MQRCSISVSPNLNQPVLRAPEQGVWAQQIRATFLTPCRPGAASRRHPPLRLSRCACAPRTRALASLGESSASGNAEEKASADTQPPSDFFDRTPEQAALQTQLASRPSRILVITGPRSSGKTALLKHVLAQRAAPDRLQLRVDGRSGHLSRPAALCDTLTEQGGFVQRAANWLERLGAFQGVYKVAASTVVDLLVSFVPMPGLSKAVQEVIQKRMPELAGATIEGGPRKAASIQDVVDFLTAAFGAGAAAGAAKAADSWPVIVFDEANVLIKWQEGDEGARKDLDLLLGFLVQVTKQDCLAHVVLATSDYSFTAWLAEAISDQFFKVEVVGDFPEDEAREFFKRELSKAAAQAPVLQGEAWEMVYDVCGGNPGFLRTVAVELSSAPSLEEVDAALLGVRSYIMGKVARAATSGQVWTPRQYLTAVVMLLQSPHYAVIDDDMRAALGDGGGAALLAMVKEGLLGLHAHSDWARDLPPEAYGDERQPVVTAASAVHLYCMRRLFGERGEGAAERLRALDGKQAAPTEGSSADSPAQDELRRDIDAVERDIAKVGDEIEAVKATKEEGWQEEVRALRKKEEQLREKEKQLREELLLLLRR